MSRVIRTICALFGCAVAASSALVYVIVQSPHKGLSISYGHVFLFVVAFLAFLKATILFRQYLPNPRYVAELACAIHAEICRYKGNGFTKLSLPTAHKQTTCLLIDVMNGAAVIRSVDRETGLSRRLDIEPTGRRIIRRSNDRGWLAAPLVLQLQDLLTALRCKKNEPSFEASWVSREDQ